MVTALPLRRLDARVDVLEERLEAARREQLLAAEQARDELAQMRALLTRLVGSVQALDAQVQSQQAELSELRAEVATQKHTIAALRGQR